MPDIPPSQLGALVGRYISRSLAEATTSTSNFASSSSSSSSTPARELRQASAAISLAFLILCFISMSLIIVALLTFTLSSCKRPAVMLSFFAIDLLSLATTVMVEGGHISQPPNWSLCLAQALFQVGAYASIVFSVAVLQVATVLKIQTRFRRIGEAIEKPVSKAVLALLPLFFWFAGTSIPTFVFAWRDRSLIFADHFYCTIDHDALQTAITGFAVVCEVVVVACTGENVLLPSRLPLFFVAFTLRLSFSFEPSRLDKSLRVAGLGLYMIALLGATVASLGEPSSGIVIYALFATQEDVLATHHALLFPAHFRRSQQAQSQLRSLSASNHKISNPKGFTHTCQGNATEAYDRDFGTDVPAVQLQLPPLASLSTQRLVAEAAPFGGRDAENIELGSFEKGVSGGGGGRGRWTLEATIRR
ncbi:hypothetical protein BDY24DRAFT_440098 [Mrakia frigida]|uniref:uncharacterized protein n=1 Tax=Mrakia frigida TaxID=29902 RepID=UPI003FCC1D47